MTTAGVSEFPGPGGRSRHRRPPRPAALAETREAFPRRCGRHPRSAQRERNELSGGFLNEVITQLAPAGEISSPRSAVSQTARPLVWIRFPPPEDSTDNLCLPSISPARSETQHNTSKENLFPLPRAPGAPCSALGLGAALGRVPALPSAPRSRCWQGRGAAGRAQL